MHIDNRQLRDAFPVLASGLPGRLVIALAEEDSDQPLVLGVDRPFHAWSTIKVPVLAALLSTAPPEALGSHHHDLAHRAITESDNPAIVELFALLAHRVGGPDQAAATIERLFRLSGDERSTVALAPPPPGAITPFGQTGWSAADSTRFFGALAAGRLLKPGPTAYLLDLMGRIVPEQRWGLGSIDLGAPLAFKAGWGPEPDGTCLVRQSGVLLARAAGPQPQTAISLVAEPPPGEDSFDVGVGMITRAAAWIATLPS